MEWKKDVGIVNTDSYFNRPWVKREQRKEVVKWWLGQDVVGKGTLFTTAYLYVVDNMIQ